MFLDDIIRFIENNPQITMVTNRGLETADRKVVFLARDLDTRYPELQKYFTKEEPVKEPVQEMGIDIPEELAAKEEPIEEVVEEEKPKKKAKKK